MKCKSVSQALSSAKASAKLSGEDKYVNMGIDGIRVECSPVYDETMESYTIWHVDETGTQHKWHKRKQF